MASRTKILQSKVILAQPTDNSLKDSPNTKQRCCGSCDTCRGVIREIVLSSDPWMDESRSIISAMKEDSINSTLILYWKIALTFL